MKSDVGWVTMNSRRLRVLHTIHSLAGGGAERQLLLLCQLSATTSFEMAVFYVKDAGIDVSKIDMTFYRSATSNRFNIGIVPSLHRAIKNFRPHVIHAWLPPSVSIPTMALARIHHRPCLFSYRNAMSFHGLLTRIEFGLAWLAADRIVANNPVSHSARQYQRLFDQKNGVVIHNAVLVDAKHRKELGKREMPTQFEILFVGRIEKQKNWSCLIQSLELLPPTMPWHLTVCGDGHQRVAMATMVESLGKTKQVSMCGYQQDIHLIMQKADVLVLPSLYEGMPNVLLEALTLGVPCVASDIPAHRFIDGGRKCVRMFNPFAPAELAECLVDVFNCPELSIEMVKAGIDVAKEFARELMIQKYVALYESMIM
jgi:glycosyltransferase involved in cell wall biosynthesis